MQKNESGSLLQPYTKNNSKWSNNPNIKATTIELSEEKLRANLQGLGFGNGLRLDTHSMNNKRKDRYIGILH